MVHALEESWRVLRPGGTLVDIRPYSNNPCVTILSGQKMHQAGRIDDSQGLAADLAADRAVQTLVDRGFFARQNKTHFPLAYYWDSVKEMEAYITERWADFAHLPDEVLEKAQRLAAAARAPVRVRVQREMLIARYQKQSPD